LEALEVNVIQQSHSVNTPNFVASTRENRGTRTLVHKVMHELRHLVTDDYCDTLV
jgi:hypothetical protein